MPGPWEKYGKAPTAGPWSKYQAEQAPSAPPEKPALTLASATFPNARGEAPNPIPYPMSYGVLPKDVTYQPPRGAGVIGDALSLPTRAAGAVGGLLGYSGATGSKQGLEALADPETGLGRPVREWSGGLVSSGLSGGEDGQRGLLDYGKAAAGAIPYLAASVVEDPTVLIGGAAKLAPKAIGGLTKKAVTPVAEAVEAAGKASGKGAAAVSERLIRRDYMPLKIHEKSGWSYQNAIKHKLYGKDVGDLAESADQKLAALYKQQKELIQAGKAAGGRVDFQQALDETMAKIEKGGDSELWDRAPGIMEEYKRRLSRIRDAGKADPADLRKALSKDVADAQIMKSDIGEDAAFASKKGVPGIDEGAAVRGRFAAILYGNVKDQIEKNTPEGLREINKAMSEIIPLRNAAEHRAAVTGRQRIGKLTDFIMGGGAMVEPTVGVPALVLKKLVDSPRFTKVAGPLQSFATKMAAAKTPAEASFYAKKLEALGVTAAEIQALSGAAELAPNAIPFRKVAERDTTQPVAMRK